MLGLFAYTGVLLAVSLALPQEWWSSTSPHFLLAIGLVAAWRYSWGATHLVRSLIYRKIVFPRLRKQADALGHDGMPEHIYLLLTSFRIDTDTTHAVYRAAFLEAIRCNAPVTLVASIVEIADQRLITQLFASLDPPAHVDLRFIRIAGTGKRDALAQGFRAISLMRPAPDSVTAVIDGDSILDPGLLRASMPFFKLRPKMDALTTDETCEVVGAQIFRDWYNMRFAQRQILMCSIGLSRRVLTLTGRMSAFRSSVSSNPEFIRMVEDDSVHHWRLGRFKFLTGDDKSTWFYILRSGREMLYVPDARVVTIEHPPHPVFMTAASMLMVRWFGNMLRTNSRALALGPRRMGLFTWWAILDQRVTMWTSLIGLTGALWITLFKTPFALVVYLYWVALTRFVQTLTLLTVRKDVSWNFPFLLFFNQIFGSLVKTYIFFRLDRQRWTRQKTVGARSYSGFQGQLVAAGSQAMHVVSLLIFITLIGLYLGHISVPNQDDIKILF